MAPTVDSQETKRKSAYSAPEDFNLTRFHFRLWSRSSLKFYALGFQTVALSIICHPAYRMVFIPN